MHGTSGAFDWAEAIRTEGIVRLPFADRQTAIVHDADIASVAAAVLTKDGHGGQTYTIPGPDVLTPRAMVSMIGVAIGRDIPFIELTAEEAQAEWQASGMAQDVIDFLMWVYGNTPPIGYTVTQTVAQITGHSARPFAQWAAENAEAFRIATPV